MKCGGEKVKEVTKLLSKCTFQNASSEKEEKELFHKGSSRLYDYDIIQCLVEDLFIPWDDKMKQTSAWYFNDLGGTTSLVQIHKGVRSLVKNAKLKAVQIYGIFFESISCDAFTNYIYSTFCWLEFKRKMVATLFPATSFITTVFAEFALWGFGTDVVSLPTVKRFH